MDQRRHGLTAADERDRATVGRRPQPAPTVERTILDLQHAVGNRGVAALLGGGVVQRKPAPYSTNDGGVLTLGSGGEIPIESATWSMSVGVATDARGSTQAPTMHQASIDIGLLTLTRLQDKDSQRAMELIGTEHKNGNIRLVRPSRDGALPGTNLDLTDVTVVSYASVGGDRPRDRLELGVGWMKIAGMGKDEVPNLKKGKPVMPPTSWQLKVGGGGADAWPPIPLISAKFSLADAGISTGERRRPAGGKPNPGPFRATVVMGAGMGLTRLAQVPARGEHLEIAIAESGTDRFEMHEAFVEKISNAGEPDVVQVDLIAQTGGFTKATGGGKTGGQAGASTR